MNATTASGERAVADDGPRDGRKLGAEIVLSLYRLVKLAQMHAIDNQAIARLLETTTLSIGAYCRSERSSVSLLFARGAVNFGGAPLRASRVAYEQALELGAMLLRCGGAELAIAGDVTGEDLRTFATAVVASARDVNVPFAMRGMRRIQLRSAREDALMRDIDAEVLSERERVVRTYASAVVMLRRSFESLHTEHPRLPRKLKRIAQSIVDLSAGRTPALLGVTSARNANHDEAGRAVNSAILAVGMGRQVTDDRLALCRIAMAALLFDVGQARMRFHQRAEIDDGWEAPSSREGGVQRALTETEQRALPAITVGLLTALGRVHAAAIEQSVIAYEALWLRRREFGAVYRGARAPTLHARLVAMARMYCEMLISSPGAVAPTPAEVIAQIDAHLSSLAPSGRKVGTATFGDSVDRTVLRLLMATTSVVGAGTLFELSTREVAVVTDAGAGGDGQRAAMRLRIVLDENGGVVDRGDVFSIDASSTRRLVRMIGTDPSYIRRPAASPDVSRVTGHPSVPTPRPSQRAAPATRSVAPSSVESGVVRVQAASAPEIRFRSTSAPPPPSPISASPAASARGGRSVAHDAETVSVAAVVAASRQAAEAVAIDASGAPTDDDDTLHTVETAAPPHVAVARAPAAHATTQPLPAADATGTLAQTPLAHLLVHLLSRRLSGSLLLRSPTGDEFAFFVDEGAPRIAWSSTGAHRIGDVLVSLGALSEGQIEPLVTARVANATRVASRLVDAGAIDETTRARALRRQLLLRAAMAAQLPDATAYAFFSGVDLVARIPHGASGRPLAEPCDPLSVVASAVRGWGDHARVEATLTRLGERPITLHPLADLMRFSFTEAERAAVGAIARSRDAYSAYVARGRADFEPLRSALYTLAITRHIDIGVADANPIGVELPPEPMAAELGRSHVARNAPPIERRLTWMPGEAPPSMQRTGRGPSPSWRPEARMSPPSSMGDSSERAAPSSDGAPGPASVAAGGGARRPVGRRTIPVAANPVIVSWRRRILERVQAVDTADHYEALRVDKAASRAAIVAAFEEGRADFDPARLPAELHDLRDVAARMLRRLSEAHRVLSSPRLRAEHDEVLDEYETPDFAAPIAEEGEAGARDSTGSSAPVVASIDDAPSSQLRSDSFAEVDVDDLHEAEDATLAQAIRMSPTPSRAGAQPPPAAPPASAPRAVERVATTDDPKLGAWRAKIAATAEALNDTTHYALLAVAPNATSAEITAAYFAAAKVFHPDRLPEPLAPLRTTAARITSALGDAQRTLSDPQLRARYDATLESGKKSQSKAEDDAEVERVLAAATMFQRAEAMLARGDHEAAARFAKRAVEGDPDNPEYVAMHAWFAAQSGGAESQGEALRTLDKIVVALPRSDRVRFFRGAVRKMLGRSREAIEDFRAAVELNPKNVDAARELRLDAMRSVPSPANAGPPPSGRRSR